MDWKSLYPRRAKWNGLILIILGEDSAWGDNGKYTRFSVCKETATNPANHFNVPASECVTV